MHQPERFTTAKFNVARILEAVYALIGAALVATRLLVAATPHCMTPASLQVS
jgi:hypothetical protein